MLTGRAAAEAELARVTIGDAELAAAVGVPVEVAETVHTQIIKLLNAQHHCKMHHLVYTVVHSAEVKHLQLQISLYVTMINEKWRRAVQ